MRKDREQANVLRKSGMSYREIMERMAVPRSTLSYWFKGQKWSNDIAIECAKKSRNAAAIRMVVLNTVRGGRLKKIYEDARQDAFVDFEELKYHPLFISGVMTYWAHGDKTSKSRISISSTDARTVKIFRLFLENVCGVSKYRANLLLKTGDDERSCISDWIDKTGLKQEQFGKSLHFSSINTGKSVIISHNYGVCNIGLSSAYLKNKILRWIELMSIEIGEEKYLRNVS